MGTKGCNLLKVKAKSHFLRWVFCWLVFAVVPGAAQTWIQLQPSGQTPPPVICPSAVYNPITNRMIVFGGGDPGFNTTWVLSDANGLGGTPEWTQLEPIGDRPIARHCHTAVYDPPANRMTIFGGCADHFCNVRLADVWVLMNADGTGGPPQWIQLFPSGTPPPSRSHLQAAYDSTNNRMIIFGGRGASIFSPLNDTWVLTNANGLGGQPQWIQLAPAGTLPVPRVSHSAVYDALSNRLIIFGAHPVGSNPSLNDTWVLANANGLGGPPQWTQLNPTNPPPGRYGHPATYDPATNRMMFFSGTAPVGYVSDSWVLTNANGIGGPSAWSRIIPTGALPIAREGHRAVYDQASNRMVIFGGWTGFQLNDTWVLTNANGVVGPQISVDQMLPNHGGNAGVVTARVIGSGFQEGAAVKLAGLGPDIEGANVSVPNSSVLTATFDLTGAVPGPRDVVVTNLGEAPVTLARGFTIEQGGAPQISVDILGPNLIRIGREQTYYLNIRNLGSIDSAPGVAVFQIPATVEHKQISGTDLFVAGSTSETVFDIPQPPSTASKAQTTDAAGTLEGINTLLFASSGVPAGSSQIATIRLTLPVGVPDTSFTAVAAWPQDLTNLPFDDFLIRRGIVFIPFNDDCPECLDKYAAQLEAHVFALSKYFDLRDAEINLQVRLVELPSKIGVTVAAAVFVSSLGLPAVGTIALSTLIAAATACAENFFGLESGQSCLADLRVIGASVFSAFDQWVRNNPNASLPLRGAVTTLLNSVSVLLTAIGGSGNVLDAFGAVQAARGQLEQSLGPYTIARTEFLSCLAARGESVPESDLGKGSSCAGSEAS